MGGGQLIMFWSTFHNPPKRAIAITTSLQGIQPAPAKGPCPTARRLAMLRVVVAGATCPTTRAMVRRLMAAWWGKLAYENGCLHEDVSK